MVICLERGADLHMVQLMPLPLTVSCFSKIQIGFTFLVPAHPGSPGQRVVKPVCVCVYCYYNSVKNVDLQQQPHCCERSLVDSLHRAVHKLLLFASVTCNSPFTCVLLTGKAGATNPGHWFNLYWIVVMYTVDSKLVLFTWS